MLVSRSCTIARTPEGRWGLLANRISPLTSISPKFELPSQLPGIRQLSFKSVSETIRLTLVAGLNMSKIAYSGVLRKECAAERNELEDVRPRNVLPQNAEVWWFAFRVR